MDNQPRSGHQPLRLGVLLSGGGRSLENLVERIGSGDLPARIALVVSSHPEAGGLERARRHGLPFAVVDCRALKDAPGGDEEFSTRIADGMDRAGVDLVVMAGFIRRWRIPPRYRGKVMNIHPALLPAFGGRGFYGERVHQAVLAAESPRSGCTVHFADDDYDRGPIILQRVVEVRPGDTPHSLAERVFAEECIAYPEAIRLFAEGRIQAADGKVKITGACSPAGPGSPP